MAPRRPDLGPRRPRSVTGRQVDGGLMVWPRRFVRAGRDLAGSVIRRESPAERHAAEIWERARTQVWHRQQALRERPWRPGRDQIRVAWDLEAVSLVAAHVEGCDRCWRIWVDGDCPADYLTEALLRSGVRDVVETLTASITVRRKGKSA